MDMGTRNWDQGANERTWTVVYFLDLCVPDFRYAGSLQQRIEWSAITSLLLL